MGVKGATVGCVKKVGLSRSDGWVCPHDDRWVCQRDDRWIR